MGDEYLYVGWLSRNFPGSSTLMSILIQGNFSEVPSWC